MAARLSTEAVIRAATSAEGTARDREEGENETVSFGDTSLRHTDIDTAGGGASKLTKKDLGSSALMAALTLHPCVHISGCGDASLLALQMALSTVGECKVVRELDEDGSPTGEASATFGSANAAAAAIQRFDGSRFDDGVLQLSVSKRAAQGSLTTRGRGRGRGSDRMTFYDRQQDLIGKQMAERAQSEKDAFAMARAAALSSEPIPAGPPARPAGPSARAAVDPPAKRAKHDNAPAKRLPGCFVIPRATQPAAAVVAPAAPVGGAGVVGEGDSEAEGATGGGLLGLAGYGDSDSED